MLPTPLGLNNSTLHLDPVSEVKGSTGLSSDILAPLSADRLTMVKEKGAYSVPFVIQFHVDNSPCFHAERKLSCPPISPEHFGSRASRQPTPEAPVSIADRSLRVASLPWRSDSLGRRSSRLFLPSQRRCSRHHPHPQRWTHFPSPAGIQLLQRGDIQSAHPPQRGLRSDDRANPLRHARSHCARGAVAAGSGASGAGAGFAAGAAVGVPDLAPRGVLHASGPLRDAGDGGNGAGGGEGLHGGEGGRRGGLLGGGDGRARSRPGRASAHRTGPQRSAVRAGVSPGGVLEHAAAGGSGAEQESKG